MHRLADRRGTARRVPRTLPPSALASPPPRRIQRRDQLAPILRGLLPVAGQGQAPHQGGGEAVSNVATQRALPTCTTCVLASRGPDGSRLRHVRLQSADYRNHPVPVLRQNKQASTRGFALLTQLVTCGHAFPP